jgi:hypothetical protein
VTAQSIINATKSVRAFESTSPSSLFIVLLAGWFSAPVELRPQSLFLTLSSPTQVIAFRARREDRALSALCGLTIRSPHFARQSPIYSNENFGRSCTSRVEDLRGRNVD